MPHKNSNHNQSRKKLYTICICAQNSTKTLSVFLMPVLPAGRMPRTFHIRTSLAVYDIFPPMAIFYGINGKSVSLRDLMASSYAKGNYAAQCIQHMLVQEKTKMV